MNKQITGEKTLEENTNVQEEQLKENQEVTDVTNAEDTFFKKLNAIADNLGTRIETLETNLTNIKEQFDTAKPVRHTENKGTFLSDVKERENKSFGDFIWNVYAGNTTKLRNKYKAMSEGSGSGGGWTVPQEYVAQLLQAVEDNGVIEKQSTVFTMARNTLNIPSMKHNATYVDGQSNFHAGVHFTSVGEGTDLASNANTQPKFEMITLTANKQAGVTKMSNELDEDSVFSLEGVLIKIFTDALAYRKDWLFLNGSGAGEPLGILNSSAYVSYDLTDSSPTVAELAGMRAQLLPASYDKACWIVNPLLSHLIVGLDNDAVSFSNITGKPSTTLFGLPVFYSTAMPTTVADGGIMLADLNYYLIGQRASLDIAFSAHTDFDTDEVKWRVVWRGDGQPWLRNPIPISSSDEVSPFIVST
jgi:HK97 family phage major capsid protein